jgi:hypothetical protein
MNIALWRYVDLLHMAWLYHYEGSSANPRLTFLIEPAGIPGVFSIIIDFLLSLLNIFLYFRYITLNGYKSFFLILRSAFVALALVSVKRSNHFILKGYYTSLIFSRQRISAFFTSISYSDISLS